MGRSQRGDTLVEVLLSMSLLTLILLTTWGLANRSTQAGLNARERIEMVNQMKQQAEILKSKFATNPGANPAAGVAASTNLANPPCTGITFTSAAKTRTLHFNDSAARVDNLLKEVRVNEAYVWVEWANNTSYWDFYVRGCWKTVGGTQKRDSSQFIVRLNK